MRVLLLIVALSAPALAYLDPATGSLLVQALLAGLAAVAVGFRRIKHWFLSLTGRAPAAEESTESPTPDEDENEQDEEAETDDADQEES